MKGACFINNNVMESLISNIIRPFRFTYSLLDLGHKMTEKYTREDAILLNDRGLKIHYSYFVNNLHRQPNRNCLIYAHCNSGCRVEGIQFVDHVIDMGWNLCLFDFTGSGISEGECISLGHYEAMDLEAIVSEMLKRGNTKIHLWGRSMGAATIILYLSSTKQIQSIVSCVLDSPYSSLWRVIRQFGSSRTKIPEFILEHVMQFMRKKIKKQHNFDIKSLELQPKVQKIVVPIMYIASANDSFVSCDHTTELYKWTSSPSKVLEYIDKQHNSPRDALLIQTGLAYMKKCLNQLEKSIKNMKFFKSKGKQMTGYNMAELITKPIGKRPSKIKRQQPHEGSSNRSSLNIQTNQHKNQRHNRSNILLYCCEREPSKHEQQKTQQQSQLNEIPFFNITTSKFNNTTVLANQNNNSKTNKSPQPSAGYEIKRFHSFSFISSKGDLPEPPINLQNENVDRDFKRQGTDTSCKSSIIKLNPLPQNQRVKKTDKYQKSDDRNLDDPMKSEKIKRSISRKIIRTFGQQEPMKNRNVVKFAPVRLKKSHPQQSIQPLRRDYGKQNASNTFNQNNSNTYSSFLLSQENTVQHETSKSCLSGSNNHAISVHSLSKKIFDKSPAVDLLRKSLKNLKQRVKTENDCEMACVRMTREQIACNDNKTERLLNKTSLPASLSQSLQSINQEWPTHRVENLNPNQHNLSHWSPQQESNYSQEQNNCHKINQINLNVCLNAKPKDKRADQPKPKQKIIRIQIDKKLLGTRQRPNI